MGQQLNIFVESSNTCTVVVVLGSLLIVQCLVYMQACTLIQAYTLVLKSLL